MSMRLTIQQKRKQYRTIYEAIWKTPRIFVKDLSLLLDCTQNAASNRLKESLEYNYIVGPEIRKKSYSNLKEYMYFINCENPEFLYLKYREDPDIIYHALTSGFCDLWIIAKEKIDVKGEIILEGYRSDYNVSYAPDRTWDTALEIMQKRIADFNPRSYKPQHIPQTHFDKTINWNSEDELLYRYFKYDLRRNLKPVMEKYQISAETLYSFLSNLSSTCTVFTSYFPNSLPGTDSYLFMIETDYEDFIIDLFSELPTTATFFKNRDKLFAFIHVTKPYIRTGDLSMDVSSTYIPSVVVELIKKGIVSKKKHCIVEYDKSKDI
jgi:hypothetical protein